MSTVLKIIAAILAMFIYSVSTTMFIVAGIESNGHDPGSPIIMLFGLLFITFALSFILIFLTIRIKVLTSVVIFLVMYIPCIVSILALF